MTTSLPARTGSLLLLAGALAALISFEVGFAVRPPARLDPTLAANVVVVDLTLGGAFLVWFLGVRRGILPRIALPLGLLAALGLSRLLVGEHDPVALRVVEAVAIVAELALFVAGFRAIARGMRGVGREGDDPLTAVRRRVGPALGNGVAADLVASELTAVWCATAGWFATPPVGGTDGGTFTYGRRSGALYGALLGVGLLELGVMHLVVAAWSEIAAWVLTALSAYGLIWIAGDWRASRLRPVTLEGDHVVVRAGLRWTAHVRLADVRAAAAPDWRRTFGSEAGEVNTALFGAPSVVLELDDEVPVVGPFGVRRRARRIGVALDDPDSFRDAVAAADPGASHPARERRG